MHGMSEEEVELRGTDSPRKSDARGYSPPWTPDDREILLGAETKVKEVPSLSNNVIKRLLPKGSYTETVKVLAKKWGGIMDVDPLWIVAHCKVESSMQPLAHNESGNAYGLMQIKPATATHIVHLAKAEGLSKDPRVAPVLRNWKGEPENLFNPELNLMLGSIYLSYLKKKFDTEDHKIVAAAYNQGPGAMRKALREKKMTAPMNHYVASIEEAKREFA